MATLTALVLIIVLMHIHIGTQPLTYRPIDSTISALYKVGITCKLIRFNVEHATKLLLYVHEKCEENGIPIILAEGTALGLVRDGALIPWDDDVDLMIEHKYKEKFIAKVLPNLHDFRITKVWNNGNFISLFKSFVAIDIEFIKEGLQCSCTINGCVDCPVTEILDTLTTVESHGKQISCWGPEMLEHVYGSSWRTPMHRFNRSSRVKGT